MTAQHTLLCCVVSKKKIIFLNLISIIWFIWLLLYWCHSWADGPSFCSLWSVVYLVHKAVKLIAEITNPCQTCDLVWNHSERSKNNPVHTVQQNDLLNYYKTNILTTCSPQALWIWLLHVHTDIDCEKVKGLQVSIMYQNQIMINLLCVDVFLAAAKAQEAQRDFLDNLGWTGSVQSTALRLTVKGWCYFKKTPEPLAGPPHVTVQRRPP